MIKELHENIIKANLDFMSSNRFYYYFLLDTNFQENNSIPTGGIRYRRDYRIEIVYNKEFIDKLSIEQTKFFLIHEIYHFLYSHQERKRDRDHDFSNKVMDMIINSDILNNFHSLPAPVEKYFTIPKEYKGEPMFEMLYEWCQDNKDNEDLSDETKEMLQDPKESDSNSEQGSGSGQGSGKPQLIDDHSVQENGDLESEEEKKLPKANSEGSSISDEIKKEIIDNIVNKCEARGTVTGNIKSLIDRIRPSKVNYLKMINRCLTSLIGNIKKKTWQKPNRKGLPLKGYKKYKNRINVLLDTSGSMSGGLIEKSLSYVFQNKIELNLIQVDTDIQDIKVLKSKNDFKKLTISGYGGTELQPGIDLVKSKYNTYPTLILTDGYCDTLCFDGLRYKSLIISVGTAVELRGSTGKVTQVVIKEEDV